MAANIIKQMSCFHVFYEYVVISVRYRYSAPWLVILVEPIDMYCHCSRTWYNSYQTRFVLETYIISLTFKNMSWSNWIIVTVVLWKQVFQFSKQIIRIEQLDFPDLDLTFYVSRSNTYIGRRLFVMCIQSLSPQVDVTYSSHPWIHNRPLGQTALFTGRARGRFNKKDSLTRYGNSHVKDKTS